MDDRRMAEPTYTISLLISLKAQVSKEGIQVQKKCWLCKFLMKQIIYM